MISYKQIELLNKIFNKHKPEGDNYKDKINSLLSEHDIVLEEIIGVINSEYKIFSMLLKLLNSDIILTFPRNIDDLAVEYTGKIVLYNDYLTMNDERLEYDQMKFDNDIKQLDPTMYEGADYKSFKFNNINILPLIENKIGFTYKEIIFELNNDLNINYEEPVVGETIISCGLLINKDINITIDCQNKVESNYVFRELSIYTNSKENVKLTIELINSGNIKILKPLNYSVNAYKIYNITVKCNDIIQTYEENNIKYLFEANSDVTKLEITISKK